MHLLKYFQKFSYFISQDTGQQIQKCIILQPFCPSLYLQHIIYHSIPSLFTTETCFLTGSIISNIHRPILLHLWHLYLPFHPLCCITSPITFCLHPCALLACYIPSDTIPPLFHCLLLLFDTFPLYSQIYKGSVYIMYTLSLT